MRELTVSEINQVAGGGGMTARDASRVLTMYGAGIATGAAIGAIAGGPGGMLAGAVVGAGRAATAGGVSALIYALFNLH